MGNRKGRKNWWKTKWAAWGEAIMLLVIGALFSYLKATAGIPVLVALLFIGILLIWKAYSNASILVPSIVGVFCIVCLSIWHTYNVVAPMSRNIPSHQNTPTTTKQDIRTFLESVNPEILRKIDRGQQHIHISMSIPKEVTLLALAEHSDFGKFLAIKKDLGDASDPNEWINEVNDQSWRVVYLLCPKDALIK
jgi:energy-coupling factor transporter transmembrane protein EcfT